MSLYVLDTDTLTLFEKNHPVVSAHVRAHQANELAITVLSVEQQLSGWYTELRRARGHEKLARVYLKLANNAKFLSRLDILTFSEAAIIRYEQLRSRKINIGKMDLRIAAVALEQQAILVTRNLRDFRRIPGLQIEDWSKA